MSSTTIEASTPAAKDLTPSNARPRAYAQPEPGVGWEQVVEQSRRLDFVYDVEALACGVGTRLNAIGNLFGFIRALLQRGLLCEHRSLPLGEVCLGRCLMHGRLSA